MDYVTTSSPDNIFVLCTREKRIYGYCVILGKTNETICMTSKLVSLLIPNVSNLALLQVERCSLCWEQSSGETASSWVPKAWRGRCLNHLDSSIVLLLGSQITDDTQIIACVFRQRGPARSDGEDFRRADRDRFALSFPKDGLQRLPFSSDYHSPAPTILQRLPFSSDYHSPATTILQRLPFSSDYHSPATNTCPEASPHRPPRPKIDHPPPQAFSFRVKLISST